MKYQDNKFTPENGIFDLVSNEKTRVINLVMRNEETWLHVSKDYPLEDFRALYNMLAKIQDIPNLYFSMHQSISQIPGTWICTELKQKDF